MKNLDKERKDRSKSTKEKIHELGIYSVRLSEPFIYSSRMLSPDKVDMTLAIGSPDFMGLLTVYLVYEINQIQAERGEKYDFVVGLERGDVPFGSWISQALRIPQVIVGKDGTVEGYKDLDGKNGINVGDVSTTGKSSRQVAEAMSARGAVVDRQIVVLDRDQGAAENLAALEPPIELRCVSRMDDEFFRIGLKAKRIVREEMEVVKKYRSDPRAWGQRFLRENPDYLMKCLRSHVKDGKITSYRDLEVFTEGYPELKPEFEDRVRGWLRDLNVAEEVPEFGYKP